MIIKIPLKLSNAYLLTGRRVVLVDSGSPGEEEAILAALQTHGFSAQDVSLILHTHGHADHAGTTAVLSRRLSAPTALHAADLPIVQRGDNGRLRTTRFSARLIKPLLNHRFPTFAPDIVFDRPFGLYDYGVDARVLLTPGHTAGSVSILTDDGSAIVGDILMGGFLGGTFFPQRPRLHYFLEDPAANRDSLARVLHSGVHTLYVGHGGPLAAADVLASSLTPRTA